MKNPNLFVIGMPKSGTTSLFNYLKQHNQFFLPNEKEPNYFSKDLIKESENFKGQKYEKYKIQKYKSKKNYLELYGDADNEKIICDFSTSYILSSNAIKEISKFNPKAKIIVLLREPISFLESLYYHHFNSGYENLTNLEKAYMLGSKRKKYTKNLDYKSRLEYKKYLEYKKNIGKILKYFSRRKVLLLFKEDLEKNPVKTLEKVCKFLEVKNKKFNIEKRFNERKTTKYKILYKFLLKINIEKVLKKILKEDIYKKSKKIIISNEKNLTKNEKIFLEKLKRKYYNDVVELEKFLKKEKLIEKEKDLVKLWGYDKIEK